MVCAYVNMTSLNKIELRKIGKEKILVTIKNIEKDEVLFNFERKFLDHPIKTSLQVDEGLHQISSDPESIENFLNHSCEPNGYIDFQDLTFRALRNIKMGEELTFNYLTTEWDMANKFDCECLSKYCFKKIKGFKYLTFIQKSRLSPLLSPFLKNKLILEKKRINAEA